MVESGEIASAKCCDTMPVPFTGLMCTAARLPLLPVPLQAGAWMIRRCAA